MDVFSQEIRDGLGEVVRQQKSVSYAQVVHQTEKKDLSLPKRAWAGLSRVRATNEGQPDLYYLRTILVSTVWNKNDDVFLPMNTWAARHTPEDKRFNYEHVDDDIIGHITENYVVDDEQKVIADDTAIDLLPTLFHVVTPCVLYRYWDDDDLQKRMDRVIGEIAEGKWYVSMEAAFSNFSYAIKKADGTGKVLPRGESTAFLTKHLRAYGGSGTYQDYRIGRVLENIVFTGKGLVRNPANEASVIFDQKESFSKGKDEYAIGLEYSHTSQASGVWEQAPNSKETELMSTDTKTKNDEVEQLKGQLAGLESRAVAGEQKLALANEKIAGLEARVAEGDKARQDLQDELDQERVKAKKVGRVARLVKDLELDETKASEMADKLAGLDDEAFISHANYLAEKHGEIKALKTSTTASKVKWKAPEKDRASATASKADVDSTTVEGKDPALAVNSQDSVVEKARADVVKYMSSFFDIPAQTN